MEWKAMGAALGHSKDYSLKQYLLFADKLQAKAKVSDIFFLKMFVYISVCSMFNCIASLAFATWFGYQMTLFLYKCSLIVLYVLF